MAETRPWGGLRERLLVATAASYIVSPSALGPVATDPGRSADRLSASYLIALAARVVRGQRLPPPLAGVVEWTSDVAKIHDLVLRLDEPAPGIGTLGAYNWGGKVHVAISFYLYGDCAPATAVRDEPLWQEWVKELFPAVASDIAC